MEDRQGGLNSGWLDGWLGSWMAGWVDSTRWRHWRSEEAASTALCGEGERAQRPLATTVYYWYILV